jgi:cytochrome P450
MTTQTEQTIEMLGKVIGTTSQGVAREIRMRLEDYRRALEWIGRDIQDAIKRLDVIDLEAATDPETSGIRMDDEKLLATILGAVLAGRQAVRNSLANDVCDRAQNIEDHVRVAQLIRSAFNSAKTSQ